MREALPFFPNSSYGYQRNETTGPRKRENRSLFPALKKAGRCGSQKSLEVFTKGEEDDPANKLCFREEPFGHPDFAALAGRVFDPLLEKEREEAKP